MGDYAQGTVSVTTARTKLVTVSAANDGVLVQNQGTSPVFLGGPNVTADTTATGGVSLAANAMVTVPSVGGMTHDLFAVTATGTSNVSFLMPVVT